MKYLITGVMGSGKSTIALALKAKGYNAYDSDRVKNLSYKGSPDYSWNKEVMIKLLDQPGDIFLCGNASEQHIFDDCFDKIFLLRIDQAEMEHRVLTRTNKSSPMSLGSLKEIKSWHKPFEADAIKKGALPIDATLPVDDIVEKILSYIK